MNRKQIEVKEEAKKEVELRKGREGKWKGRKTKKGVRQGWRRMGEIKRMKERKMRED